MLSPKQLETLDFCRPVWLIKAKQRKIYPALAKIHFLIFIQKEMNFNRIPSFEELTDEHCDQIISIITPIKQKLKL